MNHLRLDFLPLVGFIATIFLANWLLATFGLVPVGFGLLAPAGVYAAGLTFTFRDLVHDGLGRGWTFGAIVAGAALSALVSPQFALASGAAFLLSETADLLVYTPLRRRHWLGAVAASNTVGLAVDSALFLTLAFGSLAFLPGQLLGKLWMTALAVGVLWAVRRRRDLFERGA
jgi:queuosine precursor transporter